MAEIPAEEQNTNVVFRGRLVRLYQGRDNRPMLGLEVPPTVEQRDDGKRQKFGVRYFPWRFDWLVALETANRQSTASGDYLGQIVWLTLDLDKLAESEETWQTSKGELTAWYAAQVLVSLEDKRAFRKAAKMAKKAAKAARKAAVDRGARS